MLHYAAHTDNPHQEGKRAVCLPKEEAFHCATGCRTPLAKALPNDNYQMVGDSSLKRPMQPNACDNGSTPQSANNTSRYANIEPWQHRNSSATSTFDIQHHRNVGMRPSLQFSASELQVEHGWQAPSNQNNGNGNSTLCPSTTGIGGWDHHWKMKQTNSSGSGVSQKAPTLKTSLPDDCALQDSRCMTSEVLPSQQKACFYEASPSNFRLQLARGSETQLNGIQELGKKVDGCSPHHPLTTEGSQHHVVNSPGQGQPQNHYQFHHQQQHQQQHHFPQQHQHHQTPQNHIRVSWEQNTAPSINHIRQMSLTAVQRQAQQQKLQRKPRPLANPILKVIPPTLPLQPPSKWPVRVPPAHNPRPTLTSSSQGSKSSSQPPKPPPPPTSPYRHSASNIYKPSTPSIVPSGSAPSLKVMSGDQFKVDTVCPPYRVNVDSFCPSKITSPNGFSTSSTQVAQPIFSSSSSLSPSCSLSSLNPSIVNLSSVSNLNLLMRQISDGATPTHVDHRHHPLKSSVAVEGLQFGSGAPAGCNSEPVDSSLHGPGIQKDSRCDSTCHTEVEKSDLVADNLRPNTATTTTATTVECNVEERQYSGSEGHNLNSGSNSSSDSEARDNRSLSPLKLPARCYAASSVLATSEGGTSVDTPTQQILCSLASALAQPPQAPEKGPISQRNASRLGRCKLLAEFPLQAAPSGTRVTHRDNVHSQQMPLRQRNLQVFVDSDAGKLLPGSVSVTNAVAEDHSIVNGNQPQIDCDHLVKQQQGNGEGIIECLVVDSQGDETSQGSRRRGNDWISSTDDYALADSSVASALPLHKLLISDSSLRFEECRGGNCYRKLTDETLERRLKDYLIEPRHRHLSEFSSFSSSSPACSSTSTTSFLPKFPFEEGRREHTAPSVDLSDTASKHWLDGSKISSGRGEEDGQFELRFGSKVRADHNQSTLEEAENLEHLKSRRPKAVGVASPATSVGSCETSIESFVMTRALPLSNFENVVQTRPPASVIDGKAAIADIMLAGLDGLPCCTQSLEGNLLARVTPEGLEKSPLHQLRQKGLAITEFSPPLQLSHISQSPEGHHQIWGKEGSQRLNCTHEEGEQQPQRFGPADDLAQPVASLPSCLLPSSISHSPSAPAASPPPALATTPSFAAPLYSVSPTPPSQKQLSGSKPPFKSAPSSPLKHPAIPPVDVAHLSLLEELQSHCQRIQQRQAPRGGNSRRLLQQSNDITRGSSNEDVYNSLFSRQTLAGVFNRQSLEIQESAFNSSPTEVAAKGSLTSEQPACRSSPPCNLPHSKAVKNQSAAQQSSSHTEDTDSLSLLENGPPPERSLGRDSDLLEEVASIQQRYLHCEDPVLKAIVEPIDTAKLSHLEIAAWLICQLLSTEGDSDTSTLTAEPTGCAASRSDGPTEAASETDSRSLQHLQAAPPLVEFAHTTTSGDGEDASRSHPMDDCLRMSPSSYHIQDEMDCFEKGFLTPRQPLVVGPLPHMLPHSKGTASASTSFPSLPGGGEKYPLGVSQADNGVKSSPCGTLQAEMRPGLQGNKLGEVLKSWWAKAGSHPFRTEDDRRATIPNQMTLAVTNLKESSWQIGKPRESEELNVDQFVRGRSSSTTTGFAHVEGSQSIGSKNGSCDHNMRVCTEILASNGGNSAIARKDSQEDTSHSLLCALLNEGSGDKMLAFIEYLLQLLSTALKAQESMACSEFAFSPSNELPESVLRTSTGPTSAEKTQEYVALYGKTVGDLGPANTQPCTTMALGGCSPLDLPTPQKEKKRRKNKAPDQFFRTKMCPFFFLGRCQRQSGCGFAHSVSELRTPLDLSKTKLCRKYEKGDCQLGEACRFAHGHTELRCTVGYFKTSMCSLWENGSCPFHETCRHAHGQGELRCRNHQGRQTGHPNDFADSPA